MKRIVVVTGGARGIGLAIASRFANASDAVTILDRDKTGGSDAVRTLIEVGNIATFLYTDVSDKSSVTQSIEEINKRYGAIDVLINCAGVIDVGTIETIEEDIWDRVININLKGAFLVTQAAIPLMIDRPAGRIINISSLAGRMGGIKTGPAYSASKAGLIGLTKAVARMVAEHRITVNAIAPGVTRTEMAVNFTASDLEQILKANPMGSLVEPSEIAEVTYFLASDQIKMITGTVIDVNGGVYMA